MRHVALSVLMNERERPRAFVRHATAKFELILRRRALPKYDAPLSKDIIPEFPIGRAPKAGVAPCRDCFEHRFLRHRSPIEQTRTLAFVRA